jgi:hypothetical protein
MDYTTAKIVLDHLTSEARDVLLGMDYYDAISTSGSVVVHLSGLDLARRSEDGEFRLTQRGRDVKEALHVQQAQRETATNKSSDVKWYESIAKSLSTEVCDLILSSDDKGWILDEDADLRILGILLMRKLSMYINGRPVLNDAGMAVRAAIKAQRSAMAAEVWGIQAAKSPIGTSRQYLVHETEDFGETWKKHDVAFTSEREATKYARQHISEWGGMLRVVEKISEYLATEWITGT